MDSKRLGFIYFFQIRKNVNYSDGSTEILRNFDVKYNIEIIRENKSTTLDVFSIDYITNKRYQTQSLEYFFGNGGNNVVILEYIDSDE